VILEHVKHIVDAIREPLGVDRWDIRFKSEPIPDARAYCLASPEYRTADIVVDPDKLETGDVLQEISVHETAHLHTWKLHELAERYGNALADSMPETHREAMRKSLLEEVRQAGEEVTTDVGHAYLRLLRRAGILVNPDPDA
jgi:uncharacterized protein (DUF2249 family)